jgi:beta-lactamase superfamily II metal-dependent hydrolase
MAVSVNLTHEPFLKHLNVHKTPHVVVTAEDQDFDDVMLEQLQAEQFDVRYVPMGEDKGAKFAEKLHTIANQLTGVSGHYAIVGTV